MNVPLLDLKAQFRTIKAEVMAAIEAVCDEQGFILGPRVADFEQAVARYIGTSHAVGVTSGSDALYLSLMALGVGPGDEVITVSFTFFATAGAISRVGAKPVFVDVRHDTFTMDPAQVEQKLTAKTKAIIPVHLFGQCVQMEPVMELARRKNVNVIEDVAQAMGASRNGVKAGAIGDSGCFSFFPSKNLGGFGDGGMITTNEKALGDKLTMLRVHGSRVKYVHEMVGMNGRLDALQAAILKVKLKYLDQWIAGRRHRAAKYERLFTEARLTERLALPVTGTGNEHTFNQFTIRAQKRDELRAYLKDKGIGTETYYPLPLHLQSCYRHLGYQKGDFPVSERATEDVLSIPIYAELTDDQQAYVVETIASFYSRN